MRKVLFILLFMSATTVSYCADVVMCQTGTNDNLQIKKYLKSVNTPDFNKDPNNLINPDVSSLVGVPSIYWKCKNGGVVEMTPPEKSAVDQAIADDSNAQEKTIAKSELTKKQWDAFIDILISEINILRSQHGLPNRTKQQLKNAIESKIDSM